MGGECVTRRRIEPFARLRAAFTTGGIPALREAYLAAARESAVFRCAGRLAELVFPVVRFLDWIVRLDGFIATHGLHGAIARLAEEFPLRWETRVSHECVEILRRAPVVVYGNHPSQITPLFVAAALGRPDLRFLCIELYPQFLPAVTPYALPLQRSLLRQWRDRFGSGFRHTLALSLLFLVEEQKRYPDAREHNRQALRAAVDHIRGGGSVLIFPMGESTGWRDWFQGIGVLARDLAQTAAQCPAYFVPFFVENESNARLYSLLSTSPLGRWRRRRLNRDPVRIWFECAVPVAQIVPDPAVLPLAIARQLQSGYRRVFSPALRRMRRDAETPYG
jgi:1-acyl-sn-glycerol-3-phosphate acyltransferase